jgi:hypothetical protein
MCPDISEDFEDLKFEDIAESQLKMVIQELI